MTCNICHAEASLASTMMVKLTCNALFTVGRSYTATYRENMSSIHIKPDWALGVFTSDLDRAKRC